MSWSFTANELFNAYEEAGRKGKNVDKLFFNEETAPYIDLYLKVSEKTKGMRHSKGKSLSQIIDPYIFKQLESLIHNQKDSQLKDKRISQLNKLIKSNNTHKKCSKDITYLKRLIIDCKETIIRDKFDDIVSTHQFDREPIKFRKQQRWNKNIYSVDSILYFPYRIIQDTLIKSYHLDMPNRNSITNQLKLQLSDKLPQKVLRLDIKNFYESINSADLMKRLESDRVLSYPHLNLINNCLHEFHNSEQQEIGLPRGISFSAGLVEYYMKDFDKEIRNHPLVLFYARFVDDIIIIVKDGKSVENGILKDNINIIHEYSIQFLDKIKLTAHDTEKFYKQLDDNYSFDYLGYNFIGTNKSGNPLVSIASNKIYKIIKKLNYTFWALYDEKDQLGNLLKPRERIKRFYLRLRYLSNEVCLTQFKKGIKAGIINTYNQVNDGYECLEKVDIEFEKLKASLPKGIKNSLNWGFKEQVIKRTTYSFTPSQIHEIVSIWEQI